MPSGPKVIGGWLRRAAREPLVVFALAGALLFGAYHLIQGARRDDPARATSAGAVSRRIDVDAPLLERLSDTFRRAWKRDPTRDELAELVLEHVDDELLYREAQRLALDRDDPAVRRRLIEKLTVMKQPQTAPPPPTDGELERWFQRRRAHFHEPRRFWFRQILFDPARHRGALNQDAARLLSDLTRRQAQETDAAAAGDPSPLPPSVEGLPDLQVAHLFGRGFLDSLSALDPGRWQGPLSSTTGLHLVFLRRREAARDPPFAEARAAALADWNTVRSKGTMDAAASLRPQYQIRVAPAAVRRLEGAPSLAPILAPPP